MRPTRSMASAASSKGTGALMPASESCVAVNAQATPMAFRFWQGTSTRPPMGSHARPSRLPRAMEEALSACSGVPPSICASAAAAMAAAEPTSAWQPPSAPATLALRESSMPTAAAHQSACWMSFSPVPRASPAEMTHPGTTPEEPAVGAATMTPMVAFCSRTAMARVTACVSGAPTSEAAAVSDAWDSSRASPPMKPPSDGRGFSMARVEDSRITWSTWAMRSSNPGEKSDSSRRRMTVPMPASCLLQRSSSSRPLANR